MGMTRTGSQPAGTLHDWKKVTCSPECAYASEVSERGIFLAFQSFVNPDAREQRTEPASAEDKPFVGPRRDRPPRPARVGIRDQAPVR